MEQTNPTLVKHREIFFNALHPDPNQARTASLLLADVPGIIHLEPVAALSLRVSYDLLWINLEQIENALVECGLHLDNRLLCKIKRALCYFSEETEMANNGCPRGDNNCTQRIFVNRYQRQNHACRDQRPEYWRKYL